MNDVAKLNHPDFIAAMKIVEEDRTSDRALREMKRLLKGPACSHIMLDRKFTTWLTKNRNIVMEAEARGALRNVRYEEATPDGS